MKHRFFLFSLLMLCSAMASWAENVDVNEATKKAEEFLCKTAKANGAKGLGSIKGVTLATSTPEYYIFNSTDNSGFVIISAESEAPTVLAYSDKGIFRTDKMSDPVKAFLNGYSEQIAEIRSKQAVPAMQTTATYEPKLLVTADYNQTDEYFNSNYSPNINGELCYSGCVATAMGIVMKYHQWPNRGTGSHSYITDTHKTSLSFDYANTSFNWDLMPMGQPSNKAESDEVSKLLKACGVAVNMDYGTISDGGSAGISIGVGNALQKYFYYDMCGELNKSTVDSETWNSLLRNEIDNNRPVIVSGTCYAVVDGVNKRFGHSFVLDGYDENGVFHFNMGWGGFNSGYYTDGAISKDHYTIGSALMGMRPRTTTAVYSPFTIDQATAVPMGNLIPGCTFKLKVSNLNNCNPDTEGALFAVVLVTESGSMKLISEKQSLTFGYGRYYSSFEFSCSIPTGTTINPTDKLWLISSEDNGGSWKRIGGYSKEAVTYAVSGHDKDMPLISPLQIHESGGIGYQLAVKLGNNFTIDAQKLINWGGVGVFNGQVAVALYDGVTNEMKCIVSGWKDHTLNPNSYYANFKITDCKVTTSMNPYKEDYLRIVTKTADNPKPSVVNWSDGNMAYVSLGKIFPYLASKKELGYMIMYYFLGGNPSDFSVKEGDINGDGKVTMADANMIFNTLK